MRKLLLVFTLFLSFGCAVMSPERYHLSSETRDVLEEIKNTDGVKLSNLSMNTSFSRMCRLVGVIRAGTGINHGFNDYIREAFNSEFRFARIYSRDGIKLSGTVDKMNFSSTHALVKGWWRIGITLKSSNGKKLASEITHHYKSAFAGEYACEQATKAFGEAVQVLVLETVSNPEFQTLLQ